MASHSCVECSGNSTRIACREPSEADGDGQSWAVSTFRDAAMNYAFQSEANWCAWVCSCLLNRNREVLCWFEVRAHPHLGSPGRVLHAHGAFVAYFMTQVFQIIRHECFMQSSYIDVLHVEFHYCGQNHRLKLTGVYSHHRLVGESLLGTQRDEKRIGKITLMYHESKFCKTGPLN